MREALFVIVYEHTGEQRKREQHRGQRDREAEREIEREREREDSLPEVTLSPSLFRAQMRTSFAGGKLPSTTLGNPSPWLFALSPAACRPTTYLFTDDRSPVSVPSLDTLAPYVELTLTRLNSARRWTA